MHGCLHSENPHTSSGFLLLQANESHEQTPVFKPGRAIRPPAFGPFLASAEAAARTVWPMSSSGEARWMVLSWRVGWRGGAVALRAPSHESSCVAQQAAEEGQAVMVDGHRKYGGK
jgi:hypothetical protein